MVIAYRELRLLELEVLRARQKDKQQTFDVHSLLALNVDSFYGIELEEFPAQIAQAAMWLVDHQMNAQLAEEFGVLVTRIPLKTSPNIVQGNALQMDWREVAPAEEINYVMGNPPFIGRQFRTPEQKAEMQACFQHAKGTGVLDYVAAWYCKAADYIAGGEIKAAFVSTSSLVQGEQVAPFWNELRARGLAHINFAHRSFKWSNEARGNAGVACVIIGLGAHEAKTKRLFSYEEFDGEPQETKAQNINGYLVDAPDVFVEKRSDPICPVPPMSYGSMPNDGGNFLLTKEEKEELIAAEKSAEKWIRPFSMGNEFIKGIPRFCLWLKNCPPQELRKMPLVMKRINAVKKARESSARAATRKLAATPALFGEPRQPQKPYLALPRVSSERREYIPIGFLPPEFIAGDKLYTVPNATLYEFGVLTSLMHMAWMRVVCGRLESRYSYSTKIVYNNFPWPQNPTEKQTAGIKTAAQAVLDARAKYPNSTLADLYDPVTMPAPLLKAHQKLDRTVDRAYRSAPFPDEAGAGGVFVWALPTTHRAGFAGQAAQETPRALKRGSEAQCPGFFEHLHVFDFLKRNNFCFSFASFIKQKYVALISTEEIKFLFSEWLSLVDCFDHKGCLSALVLDVRNLLHRLENNAREKKGKEDSEPRGRMHVEGVFKKPGNYT